MTRALTSASTLEALTLLTAAIRTIVECAANGLRNGVPQRNGFASVTSANFMRGSRSWLMAIERAVTPTSCGALHERPDDDEPEQRDGGTIQIHACSRLGRIANPPGLSVRDWFRWRRPR